MLGAIMAACITENEELYISMVGGRYLLTDHNFLDHTRHNHF